MSQGPPHSALVVSSAQSRHILNSIPTVIYEFAITGKGFRTEWISDSVKRILGYEVEEALAPDWWIDCLHPDDKAAAVKKTSLLMSQGQLVQTPALCAIEPDASASVSRDCVQREGQIKKSPP